jgi:serine phosphatase RsbU (regulator of sigma subunit)
MEIFKNILHVKRQEGYPETFTEELNYQCSHVVIPLSFIAAVAWLPYIPIDMALNPHIPLIVALRLGLTGVASLILLFLIFPRYRKKGLLLLLTLGVYTEIATAVITALSGGASHYIGGFLFVLMIIPLVPYPRIAQFSILALSVTTFFIVGFSQGMTFSGYRHLYSLNDLFFTTIVAAFLIYFLHKIRVGIWEKSKHIESQKRDLQNINKELNEKNRKIEKQQREIKQRNRMLETELKMARHIQKLMIPSEQVTTNIYTIYKPMDLLGGDFFDIIKSDNSGNKGIFISDVSGHGVAAAFITAMMKSLIQNSETFKSDPAGFLHFMNDALIDISGDNFITAFYGIYDSGKRTLTYASAGHIPPYILMDENVQTVKGKSGPPLAFLSNSELEKKGKSYGNNIMPILRNARLVFFTDGVTETTHGNESSLMFGEERLEQEILNSCHLSPDDFLNTLYRKLIEFRGNENFDDDISLICFDVH